MGKKSSTGFRSTPSAPLCLRSERTDKVIAAKIRVASGMLSRLRGLILQPRLAVGEALWLEPCNGIHTLGMTYAVAAITLRADGRVIAITREVRPGRIVWPVRGGHATVEMLPETLVGTDVRVGDRLILDALDGRPLC